MSHFSILGLGESLKNFSPNGSITIGVNDIYKHFPSDYIVCVDKPDRFSPERLNTIKSSAHKKFFSHLPEWHPIISNFQLIKLYQGRGIFTNLDSDSIAYGISSPIVACVIAYKMGAKQIDLYGVDFNTHPQFVNRNLDRAIKEFLLLNAEFKKKGIKMTCQKESRLHGLL